jgi:hypothetical protein
MQNKKRERQKVAAISQESEEKLIQYLKSQHPDIFRASTTKYQKSNIAITLMLEQIKSKLID